VLRVEFHPEAEDELTDAALYLESERRGIGDVFREEVANSYQLALAYPKIGKTVGKRVRRVEVSGFHYAVIYQTRGEALFVLAVAHHSRRPGYWRKRLPKR